MLCWTTSLLDTGHNQCRKWQPTSAFYQLQWPRSCYSQAQLCRCHGKGPRIRPRYVPHRQFSGTVNQYALSECFAQSDLLPNQRHQLYKVLQENSGVFVSTIADLTSAILVKHYIGTGNAKLIKQFTPVTTIVMKLKSRWKKCYKTTLLNLLLVLGPALLCWLGKQIKHYDSV